MIQTLEELYNALSSVPTVSVAYNHFPEDEKVPLPVIVYDVTGSRNFPADNKVFHPILIIEAQLVTANKDPATEAAVEAKLDECELVWDKTEAFLDTEKCYQIIYTFNL